MKNIIITLLAIISLSLLVLLLKPLVAPILGQQIPMDSNGVNPEYALDNDNSTYWAGETLKPYYNYYSFIIDAGEENQYKQLKVITGTTAPVVYRFSLYATNDLRKWTSILQEKTDVFYEDSIITYDLYPNYEYRYWKFGARVDIGGEMMKIYEVYLEE